MGAGGGAVRDGQDTDAAYLKLTGDGGRSGEIDKSAAIWLVPGDAEQHLIIAD
jgi:hypothetical protein